MFLLYLVETDASLPLQEALLRAVGLQVFPLRVRSCHAFRRVVRCSQAFHSVWDFFLIACIWKAADYADSFITPEQISLPSPYLYSFLRFALWSLYAFANGLVMTGLWVVAHECGHQAYSESKFINNAVGWVLHSACVYFPSAVDTPYLTRVAAVLVSLTTRGVSAMPSTMPPPPT